MFENLEFWGLLITILAGDFAIFWQNLSLKTEISDVRALNLELRRDVELEFAKCRLHNCNNNKE